MKVRNNDDPDVQIESPTTFVQVLLITLLRYSTKSNHAQTINVDSRTYQAPSSWEQGSAVTIDNGDVVDDPILREDYQRACLKIVMLRARAQYPYSDPNQRIPSIASIVEGAWTILYLILGLNNSYRSDRAAVAFSGRASRPASVATTKQRIERQHQCWRLSEVILHE